MVDKPRPLGRGTARKDVGFSPEIVSTADYHMIHRTKQPVGAIYELLLMTTIFRSNSKRIVINHDLKVVEQHIKNDGL